MRGLHLQIKKKPNHNTSFLNIVSILQAKLLKSEMSKEPRRILSENYLISSPSEIFNNDKRRLEAMWLSIFHIIMTQPSLNQFLSLPFKHMQTHLGTIKRGNSQKFGSSSCSPFRITFQNSWAKSHPPDSFGFTSKRRTGTLWTSNVTVPMLFPKPVYCINQ